MGIILSLTLERARELAREAGRRGTPLSKEENIALPVLEETKASIQERFPTGTLPFEEQLLLEKIDPLLKSIQQKQAQSSAFHRLSLALTSIAARIQRQDKPFLTVELADPVSGAAMEILSRELEARRPIPPGPPPREPPRPAVSKIVKRERPPPRPLPAEEVRGGVPGCKCRLFSPQTLAQMDDMIHKAYRSKAQQWVKRDRYSVIHRDYNLGKEEKGNAPGNIPVAIPRPESEIGVFTTEVAKGDTANLLTGRDLLYMAMQKQPCYCKGVEIQENDTVVGEVQCYSYNQYLAIQSIIGEVIFSFDTLRTFPYELISKYGKGITNTDVRKHGRQWLYDQIRSKATLEDREKYKFLRRAISQWKEMAMLGEKQVPGCYQFEVGRHVREAMVVRAIEEAGAVLAPEAIEALETLKEKEALAVS